MILPPLPNDEAERLRALHDLNILDTPPEPAFDDIAFIASFICEVPIALITLIDEERQWYKAKVGLDGTGSTRNDSFCAHAIVEPDTILEIEDALNDERFIDNPFVVNDPNIRFYAGAPLVTRDGHALGTLCVIDRVPRTLTGRQREALSALRRQVMSALELRRSNEMIASVSRKLKESNAELRSLNEEKNRMLGMAAHDLRNPISVISMYSNLILEDANGEIPPEQRATMLSVISSTSAEMLELVNDFLDISKIEAGKIKLQTERTDIVDLVARTVVLNQLLADKKGITIVTESPTDSLMMSVDASKIVQVLTNLLTNAVKFSQPGSDIRVSVRSSDSSVTVAVTDRGRGMSREKLDLLFQPFSDAHESGTAGETGTGLGLAIVKKIVEAHHGSIHVESEIGKGSTFWFELPRSTVL